MRKCILGFATLAVMLTVSMDVQAGCRGRGGRGGQGCGQSYGGCGQSYGGYQGCGQSYGGYQGCQSGNYQGYGSVPMYGTPMTQGITYINGTPTMYGGIYMDQYINQPSNVGMNQPISTPNTDTKTYPPGTFWKADENGILRPFTPNNPK